VGIRDPISIRSKDALALSARNELLRKLSKSVVMGVDGFARYCSACSVANLILTSTFCHNK
jgi:pantothenate synthetase